jgi:hypothetical protein
MIKEVVALLVVFLVVSAPWLRAKAEDMGASVQFSPQLSQFTVASLPSCGTLNQGLLVQVTDGLLPTLLGLIVGGGSTKVVVMCNGSNWVVA